MPIATPSLPDHYQLAAEIDLAKNKKLALLLNGLGFLAFFAICWLLAVFVASVRPGISLTQFSIRISLATLWQVVLLFILILVNLVIHELIHGFFFWLFTRTRPVFALRLEYAYAAAPDWYLPRGPYSVVGLAPLLIIGALGLILLCVIPINWLFIAVLLIAFNTSGSVGDLVVVARLLRSSSACLINDHGDGVYFYEPRA
jgi:hypothetical protein